MDIEKNYPFLESLFKISAWAIVLVIFIKDFNSIFAYNYNNVLRFLFLIWAFGLIYPRTVLRFGSLDRKTVSKIYSTLFVLFFSLEKIGKVIDHEFYVLPELGLNLMFSSSIFITIYPEGTIFYPLAEKFLAALSPITKRAYMIIPFLIIIFVSSVVLFVVSSYSIGNVLFSFIDKLILLLKDIFYLVIKEIFIFLLLVCTTIIHYILEIFAIIVGKIFNLFSDKITSIFNFFSINLTNGFNFFSTNFINGFNFFSSNILKVFHFFSKNVINIFNFLALL